MTLFGIIIFIIGVLDLVALAGITILMLVEAVKLPIAAAVIVAFVTVGLLAYFVIGAAPVAIGTNAIILLVLGALVVTMMIGAIIGRHSTITSWPIKEEQSFAPFDRRQSSSHALGMIGGISGAVVVFLVAIGIYFGVPPEERDIGKTMNMSNLTKKAKTPAPAPTPKVPKSDAPKTDPAPKVEAPAPDKK